MIKINNVSKRFGKQLVNSQVFLTVKSGEFVALMGPSGSGKSTLLKIIAGLIKPDEGEVLVRDKSISILNEPRLTKFRRKNIGFVFQDYSLIDYLNVRDNITFLAKANHRHVSKQELLEISQALGLEQLLSKKISQISGGQKQRVAIARSLVNRSPIILADEPTGALDISTRNLTIDILVNVANKMKTAIFCVTHDPYVASRAHKTYFLVDGKISEPFSNLTEASISQKITSLEKKYV